MYPDDDVHPEPGGPEWQQTVAGLEDLGRHIQSLEGSESGGSPEAEQ